MEFRRVLFRSGEKEYLQAVREVLMSVEEVYNQHPEFERNKIIERMVEPDRIVTFRVTWIDDKGEVQNNIGGKPHQECGGCHGRQGNAHYHYRPRQESLLHRCLRHRQGNSPQKLQECLQSGLYDQEARLGTGPYPGETHYRGISQGAYICPELRTRQGHHLPHYPAQGVRRKEENDRPGGKLFRNGGVVKEDYGMR